MTDFVLASPVAVTAPTSPVTALNTALNAAAPHDLIRGALMESRQRWRQFVDLATDLAFETDANGRIVFVLPETILGWPAGALIGQPSELLLGDDGTGGTFNPFRPTVEVRRRRTWLRRCDGRLVMMAMSATPLRDSAGVIMGARGTGIDMTDYDTQTSPIAGRLRRGEVLDQILSRVASEAGADGMMDAALWALIHALGAEGAAVIGTLSADAALEVLHECGPGASAILATATQLLTAEAKHPGHATNPEGRLVSAVGCKTRFGAQTGLALWRHANARPWDQDDALLVGSAAAIVCMILEYEAVQRELALQARTDPLTGLLNRRAFLQEMLRNIARLDRESEPGTLIFLDMDSLKTVNDRLGHAAGDQVLLLLADILRKLVRPSDLIARLGGDEFAIWLSGADHMTAAERADQLCKAVPVEVQAILPEQVPGIGVSVGLATRTVGSLETIDDLTRRADLAMYEVKRTGRGHWRVSVLDTV